MTFRFTLSHSVLGSQVISEPDGWEGGTLKLERDMDLFSLIETYNGGANDAFIFYGDNGTENGGIDFIRSVETTYGFDADITFLIEYAPDDETFSTLFSGLLDLSAKVEMKDNKMQIPVVRDSFWTKFINRFETPVNLSDLVDLDGNAVAPVGPVTVHLTPQPIRRSSHTRFGDSGESYAQFTNGSYYHIDFADFVILDEVEQRNFISRVEDTELPLPLFTIKEAGRYTFDIRIIASTFTVFNAESVKDPDDMIDFYIQFGNQAPIAFSWVDEIPAGTFTLFTLEASYELEANTSIRIYGQANITSTKDLIISGGDSSFLSGDDKEWASYCFITADTTYPATEADCYLIHDLIHGVLVRLGLGHDPFYSEFLGSTLTQTKQYDDDGCGWMYAIVKGLQLRQYTLAEKPFFISFKDIWEGINPILNLGCGYDTVEGSQVIRIEQKRHFIPSNATPPVSFSNVREISSSYDKDMIFKTIRTGYKKWQAEDISGLDDPQTKHTYATVIRKAGMDINLESGFIAAGLAIEITRRKTREKSADYKFDNDNFIIALNTDDLSPDVYLPELDEPFSAVTGLLNSDSRYNLLLTPMRNLLRWGNYLSGCLQSYLSTNFKFVSGEGNYDMSSDPDIEILCQRSIKVTNLSESDDISPSGLGYLFLPELFDIVIPMEKEEYDLIDRNEPIGISQSDSGHVNFHIKSLKYDLLRGDAIIQAWAEDAFDITVPEQEIADPPCLAEEPAPVVYDDDYQAILDYADGEGYTLPSEDQQLIENQIVVSMKSEGIWDDLDLFYYFETDGDEDYAKINWKNPGTNNLSETGTVTFTPGSGFTSDGSTGYLSTGWDPTNDGVNFTQDEAGWFVKCNNEVAASDNNRVLGSSGAAFAGQTVLLPKTSANVHGYAVNSLAPTTGSAVSSIGFFHGRRVLSNDVRLFKDGSQVGSTSTSASNGLSTVDFLVCGHSLNGAIVFSTSQVGCFGIGASMTGKESALNTILG